MLKDILESAKTTLLERFASPLLGSFTVAWCLWNWKFFVILFSNISVTKTFELVDAIAFPSWQTALFKGLVFPLATSLTYIFIYPYPAKFVHEFTLRRQREIREIQKQIEDETPLTIEESRKLRAEYVEYDRKNREIVAGLNQEIARLNAFVDAKQKSQVMPPINPTKNQELRLEPSQFEILRQIGLKGGKASEGEILSALKGDKVKIDFDLGELLTEELIRRDYRNTVKKWELALTHEGRRVLLNDGKLSSKMNHHVEAE